MAEEETRKQVATQEVTIARLTRLVKDQGTQISDLKKALANLRQVVSTLEKKLSTR